MREILFRGKRIDNGEWIEGYLLKVCNYATCSWDLSIEYKDPQWSGSKAYNTAAVGPSTVGQYTGLTDKNGKKIFEGDIVKNEYEDRKYQYFKIFYNEKTLQWEVMNKYGMRGILHNVIGNMEIIGNIHDNPELLENP